MIKIENMPPLAKLEDLIPVAGIFKCDKRWSERSRLRTNAMNNDPNFNFRDFSYLSRAAIDGSYNFAVNLIQLGCVAAAYFSIRELLG